MRAPEELSREELIALVGDHAARIAVQDKLIAELAAANEDLAARLARLEHLLSRNSTNSSMPPSKDDDPGKPAPVKPKRRRGSGRTKGKQPGAPGTYLAWTDDPDERVDRFRRAAATVEPTWRAPRIWAWLTATSATRSPRSR